jgi:hypothetical protein
MKYLLFLLTVLPGITYSQSFFTEDMLWSTMDGPGNCCNGDPCTSYYTKTANDSIINGIQYKQILNSTDSLMNEWKHIGFIREEGKKVYYRKKNTDTECLLYNFGCSIGDTLNLDCSCTTNYKFKVDSIKYLPVMGEDRKHIYLTYLINDSIDGPIEYWIEGIGSINGILNGGGGNNCMTGFYEGLLCCFKDGIKIFGAPGCNDCYLDSPNVNSLYESPGRNRFLRLYPNPADKWITIEFDNNDLSSFHFEIIDISGRLMIQESGGEQGFFNVDISAFQPGSYLYRLVDRSSNRASHGKFNVK